MAQPGRRRPLGAPMIRAALLTLATFFVLASAAQARTCRDGKTVYRQAGVRVFSHGGGFWACGKATRRPVHLASYTGPYGSFKVLGRRSGKVIFVFEFSGEGGGEDTSVGWFDGKRARGGQLAGHVSNDVLDVVVASDGGMGVISSLGEDAGVRVGYLAPGRGELVLATIDGRYAPRSLTFTTGGLRWRADGQTRTVPLTGEPLSCTAGTTLLEHEGARLFEVFKGDRDRLAACLPADTTPRILASTSVRDQDPWTLDSVKRAGSRVAFLANDRIGLLDGPTISVMRPPGYDELDDVALATVGPPVFASQGHVLRLDGTSIASLGGVIEPGTLALTDDGRVTWRNADGRAQNVPLAGEPTLTCTSGTTLLDKDGLRVFEVHTDATRLYGCTPGLPEPALLLAQGAGERVVELTRQHGLIALYVVSRRGDRVIVLGPAGVRVKAPRESLAYAELRDVTIAPDGSRISWRDRKGRPHTLDL
ncbi:hypothetical protein OJ998_32000 [Solirubrobacter taibaiensis]|nr:hypothetical protein [Solirubrobacter taibaiensis]